MTAQIWSGLTLPLPITLPLSRIRPEHVPVPQGYLPGQLYKLDSSYGNKAQLQELTAALKAAGLRPVADVVINHRCADQQDENGIWNMFKCAMAAVRLSSFISVSISLYLLI